jgi:hypothetical protein
VELHFMAPKAGKMDLQLFFMSENYIGCDKILPVKVKVGSPAARRAAACVYVYGRASLGAT